MYQDKSGGFGAQRKMYQGNWQCAKCGREINELPFDPDPARLNKLLCRDCHRERVRKFRR
jgi:CxxC-x17-CxxC domain-containing protein